MSSQLTSDCYVSRTRRCGIFPMVPGIKKPENASAVISGNNDYSFVCGKLEFVTFYILYFPRQ